MNVVNKDLIATDVPGYQLIDSGNGRKLEVIAGVVVDRPCVQAIWAPRKAEADWNRATSVCERLKDGGGTWHHKGRPPGDLSLRWRGPAGELDFGLRFTAFGHCGMFMEQDPVWRALQERSLAKPGLKIANTFAYTGCGSLAMAAAGADVYHVDSAKGVVDWGKANARMNGAICKGIHWIHDDVRNFCAFGKKRGFTYDGIVLDPPSWGHGGGKEQKWELEAHLLPLLKQMVSLLNEDGFIVFSCHSPGIQEQALVNCLTGLRHWNNITVGEMGVRHTEDDRVLPAGVYVWAE